MSIRGQEVNLDFMQDLQDADNCTSIDNVKALDTGYEPQKELLSLPSSIDPSFTEKSSELLETLLPIQNENRQHEFTHVNSSPNHRENLL